MERKHSGVSAFVLVLLATTADTAGRGRADTSGSGYVGDVCADGEGVCRLIKDCPAAIAMLQRRQQPTRCSFDQGAPIVCCPHPGNATRMCQKYAEAVYRYERTFSIPVRRVKVDQCALRGVPFIIGGQKADPNEFPHMALIGYGDDAKAPRWQCGGSLISKRYVLTAAHCLRSSIGEPRWVRLGELNLSQERELNKHEDYEIESTVAHPNYSPLSHYDDISLLRLNKDVTFTASIRPACLYTIPEIRDKELVATGWGFTDWTLPETSEHLMKVKLPVQSAQVCQNTYGSKSIQLRKGFTDATMVCAGASNRGKDTCSGDSGGPLQLKMSSPYCMYGVVGITSFGKRNCGQGNAYAVYTRVSHYVPWIESVVWADDE